MFCFTLLEFLPIKDIFTCGEMANQVTSSTLSFILQAFFLFSQVSIILVASSFRISFLRQGPEMKDLVCYRTNPVWVKGTVPNAFLKKHNTKEGTWAKLTVLKGELNFDMLTEDGEVTSQHLFSTTNQPPMIEPQAWHRIVSLTDDAECQLQFYCQPERYFEKKYRMTPPHSEVVEAAPSIPVGKVLDLGAGSGRNAFYLSQLGFSVDAWDNNAEGIEAMKEIIKEEKIQNIRTVVKDLNATQEIGETYDLIVSTVVFMFLKPETIPQLLAAMQNATKVNGYNLIVSAMDTEDYPNIGFPFTFKPGELKKYYQDWKFIKYNEDVGELHRVDEDGNRIKLRFATLLAQKIE